MNMLKKRYDVIIVGAGPSGIFTAYELTKISPEKKVLIIEKGDLFIKGIVLYQSLINVLSVSLTVI